MGHHTFDASRADKLEQPADRYRFLPWRNCCGHSTSPRGHRRRPGSGTGFYTDDVAPHAGDVYAVDVQSAMHDYYREKGVPRTSTSSRPTSTTSRSQTGRSTPRSPR